MNSIEPQISVVISTYNTVEWLYKVLLSYQYQDFKNFEVIIADDGSMNETKEMIDSFMESSNYPIKHVWHKDEGFQKTKILNKAIQQSTANYLLFTDGDCLARKDFLKTHLEYRSEGYFLSGGYFKLPLSTSKLITEAHIKNQDCFTIDWLVKNGVLKSFKNNKIKATLITSKVLNLITPTKATWNGHNASGWKKDIIAINGFDERMQYGGEDREMGERLFNLGIKAKQIRYSAICIHLDHERGYVEQKMIDENKQIRNETKNNNSTFTNYGIIKF